MRMRWENTGRQDWLLQRVQGGMAASYIYAVSQRVLVTGGLEDVLTAACCKVFLEMTAI